MSFSKATVPPYGKTQFLEEVFIDSEGFDDLTALLERKKNLILQGPPGTGKTFAAKRLAYAHMGAKDESCMLQVQFHQGSSYEDYIVGYRPSKDGTFTPELGTFAKFFRRAAEPAHRPENFYLIIDEINRANISKVFGEMLMLIESAHRNETLEIPGIEEPLCVPDNVYIIGMMNTADRGLALVDYALRRRFAFYTMTPALDHPRFIADIASQNNIRLPPLVDAVKNINNKIKDDPSLGQGFCIGHSYFAGNGKLSDRDVSAIVEYEIIPLLQEYWFDPSDEDKLEDAIETLRESIK